MLMKGCFCFCFGKNSQLSCDVKKKSNLYTCRKVISKVLNFILVGSKYSKYLAVFQYAVSSAWGCYVNAYHMTDIFIRQGSLEKKPNNVCMNFRKENLRDSTQTLQQCLNMQSIRQLPNPGNQMPEQSSVLNNTASLPVPWIVAGIKSTAEEAEWSLMSVGYSCIDGLAHSERKLVLTHCFPQASLHPGCWPIGSAIHIHGWSFSRSHFLTWLSSQQSCHRHTGVCLTSPREDQPSQCMIRKILENVEDSVHSVKCMSTFYGLQIDAWFVFFGFCLFWQPVSIDCYSFIPNLFIILFISRI